MTEPYSYKALAAAFGLPTARATGTSRFSIPVLSFGRFSSLSIGQNAFANLVNLAEIEAASKYIDGIDDYFPWRDRWLLPMAAAVAYSPQIKSGLYLIFDQVNQRTADPRKASREYFADARVELDKAVRNYWSRAVDERFGYNKIIHLALDAGWDGRTAIFLNGGGSTGATLTSTHPASARPFFAPIPFDRSHLRPPAWLAHGLLLRGETTILASQGGGAKTALALHVAVTLASDLPTVGPFQVENRSGGLKVAYLSAEEDEARLGLLVASACKTLALSAFQRSQVDANLRFHDAQSSGWRLGAPRPGHWGEIAPEELDQDFARLRAALPGTDLLILDTLAALFALPNENDNHAVTLLMQRLNRLARYANCAVLLLHHTPKMTREAAAAQRGEATLARGGGAITNSARVGLTITSLRKSECSQFAARGVVPDRVRRLEHSKVNDIAPMAPVHFELVSQQVTVHDGRVIVVRAVRFLRQTSAAATLARATGAPIMQAVDAGVPDKQGVRVPLTFGPGPRNVTHAAAEALRAGNPTLSDKLAKEAARDTLDDLVKYGCITEEVVQLPQYTKAGRPNGTQEGRGLITHWDRLPSGEEKIVAHPARPADPDAQGMKPTDEADAAAQEVRSEVVPQVFASAAPSALAGAAGTNSLSSCPVPVIGTTQADRKEG